MSTLRAVDLIRTAAENIDGLSFLTGTRLLANIEADNISLPVCILDRPIRIPVEVAAGGRMIEQFECTVFFFDKSELEYQFEFHEPIVGAMKLNADQFIVNLNSFSDYVLNISGVVYTDLINALDSNLTGVQITFTMDLIPEAEQVCPTGTFTPEGLPTFSKYLTEVVHDDTLDGKGTTESPLTVIGGGGGGVNLRVQDEGTTVTNAATTLNFTGNVTASLASAGNVTVNVPTPTPQVNADWNAVSGVAEILNKPTIPAAQIQSDWNQANNAAVDFIKNKPTIPSITGLVPYTGATADVDLGANGLDAEFLRVTGTNGNGDIHLRHQATDATATGQSTSIFADANGDVKIKNDGLDYATLKTSLITDDRVYTFPDKSGTVAMTSDVEIYTEGTGIDITSNVITNTAPDQTVVLNEGTGIDVTGTYPNFTIANTAPDQTVVLTAGTGIGVSGTYPNFTIANTQAAGTPTKMVIGGAAETSGTAITQLNSLLIEGGWLSPSKMGQVFARNYKTGANGASTIRLYVNTSDNLTGAVLVATFQASATQTTTYQDIMRRLVVLSATETFTALTTQSLANDIGNGFYSVLNIDWTTAKYLIATGQDANGSDVTKNLILSIERHENS